ncbi:hypothetical protein TEA_016478 [Camellia sinensis var. sinensis]|uniref:GTD-binding domain-containing protein n=1 Tax=Camellia sinensis var. sinensis TaxID=542762 RepID=A0A4S4DKZ1_CAMSN|nr:hypothetical protein TEA_016478 [Camellia sinensis var. sinensis]
MMGQLGETRDVANGNGDVKANIVLNDYFGEKSGDLRNGFCSKKCVNRKCNTRISLLESLESELEETPKIANGNGDFKASNEEYGDDSDEQECHEEDEEVDVMALRKLVRIERQRANAAYLELEKERLAAATAAEEAMAMILKLQNDKSLIEMEANQYRRLTEEKQLRDQEVIHSLRWIVMKHESERGLLEDQLRFFRQKLKPSVEGYEGDQSEGIHESLSFFNSDIEDSPGGDALISSLEMDLSPYENMNWEGASMNWWNGERCFVESAFVTDIFNIIEMFSLLIAFGLIASDEYSAQCTTELGDDLPLESAPAVVSASTLASLAALDSVPESAAYSLELDVESG